MMETAMVNHIRGVIEALLFVSEKPVTLEQIKLVLETVETNEIRQIIQLLQREYEEKESGMGIVEIAGGYQMLTSPRYASALRSFYKTRHKEKLSKPSLETLAIIAYKQPVSRSDIEVVRGVNSDGVMAHLLSKGLVKIVGRKDVPGRPYLYGITKEFLEYFGLRSLADLPKLEDFSSLQPPGLSSEDETPQGQESKTEEENVAVPVESSPHALSIAALPEGKGNESISTPQEN